jgi:hypothetical protein
MDRGGRAAPRAGRTRTGAAGSAGARSGQRRRVERWRPHDGPGGRGLGAVGAQHDHRHRPRSRGEPVVQLGAVQLPAGELHPPVCARPDVVLDGRPEDRTGSRPVRLPGRWRCRTSGSRAPRPRTFRSSWPGTTATATAATSTTTTSTTAPRGCAMPLTVPSAVSSSRSSTPCPRGTPGAGRRGASSGGTCPSMSPSTWHWGSRSTRRCPPGSRCSCRADSWSTCARRG